VAATFRLGAPSQAADEELTWSEGKEVDTAISIFSSAVTLPPNGQMVAVAAAFGARPLAGLPGEGFEGLRRDVPLAAPDRLLNRLLRGPDDERPAVRPRDPSASGILAQNCGNIEKAAVSSSRPHTPVSR